MKTAIYIEDGLMQLVITPETEFEKGAMKTFEDKKVDAKIFIGSFYDCRGGWTKQNDYRPHIIGHSNDKQDRNLILWVNYSPDQTE